MSNFQFSFQTMALACGLADGWVERVKKAAKAKGPGELNVFHGGSAEQVIVLQSPTSSTRVAIKPDRTELRTDYFDDFVNVDHWDASQVLGGQGQGHPGAAGGRWHKILVSWNHNGGQVVDAGQGR